MTSTSSDLRFREIFNANVAGIEAYCRRRLSPDAVADAVSETFLVAWRRIDSVPDGHEARLWLFGVARRVVANVNRSADRSERLHLRLVHERPNASTHTEGHEVVLDALSTLSDDDQELLRLLAWEELTHAEIAAVLDISPNAVGVRAHRARQRLAAVLDAVATSSDPHSESQTSTTFESDPR